MKKNKIFSPVPRISATLDYSSGVKVSNLITKFILRVLYPGENRNGSYFTREVIEQMAGTLGGVPVVGHYSKDMQDFLAHGDLTLSVTDGEVSTKLEGPVPYGFVPTDPKIWWDFNLDPDGEVREYLNVEVYLWTGRYKELDTLRDGLNKHSMELNPSEMRGYMTELGELKKPIFVVESAEFSGLCILGKGEDPCFEGSGLELSVYSKQKLNHFSEALKHMQGELNYSLKEESGEEGENMLDKENKEDTEIVLDEVEALEVDAELPEEVEVEEVELLEPELEIEEDEVVDSEPSEEELAELDADEPQELTDEELNEIDSSIDDVEVTEYSALELEIASLKEELKVFRAEKLRNEKIAVLNEYASIDEESYNLILNEIDSLTTEQVQFKAMSKELEILRSLAPSKPEGVENFTLNVQPGVVKKEISGSEMTWEEAAAKRAARK